ncbi:NADPH-dependent oxidoreductase [Agrilactobacillus fermenti]|uniref:NADPH-dependent oxidoreductase n=1 Tax=Agrilactobacillus fermenti TaxID=2586909 RepID=UPI001E3F2462|nr:NADPH-dependent oxidoreductase [Agrilactobacillus fermenti]MCD2256165.1 NADPH-dependent oxidoreductase [Agrilactobacillus fermenti]
MNINETIQRQLAHKTIRAFKPQPLDPTLVTQLVDVARHTASSQFLQAYSILSIVDPAKKAAIAKISGQPYVADNGHLFIFIVDQNRNRQIGHEKGQDKNLLGSTNKLLAGLADATLAVQNTVNAAESLGLGTVILGSILNDAQQMIDLLDLPTLTFPVLGLAIGYPDQTPQLKPRLPEKFIHFTDTYQLPDPLVPELADYDAQVHEYYDLRDTNRRVDTFTNQVKRSLMNQSGKRSELLHILHQQGFLNDEQG